MGQGSHAWGPTGTRFSPRISAAVTRCLEYFSNAALLLLSPGLASCPVLLAVYETIVGIMRSRTRLPRARPHLYGREQCQAPVGLSQALCRGNKGAVCFWSPPVSLGPRPVSPWVRSAWEPQAPGGRGVGRAARHVHHPAPVTGPAGRVVRGAGPGATGSGFKPRVFCLPAAWSSWVTEPLCASASLCVPERW